MNVNNFPYVNKQEEFNKAILDNDFKSIKLLLNNHRVDPNVDNFNAIRHSSEYGYVEIVEILLKDLRVDPSCYDNWSIGSASENGYLDIVKLLLNDSRVNPAADNNWAIRKSFENKYDEIVNLLWQYDLVQKKLKEEFVGIYNEIIKKNIKNKINAF
jgi:hypothetical protein